MPCSAHPCTHAPTHPPTRPHARPAGFMLVRLAFLVSLVVSFPLQMGPGRDALWKLLFRQELQVGGWLCVLGGGWWGVGRAGVQCCDPPGSRRALQPPSSLPACLMRLCLHCPLQGPGLWLVTYLALVGTACNRMLQSTDCCTGRLGASGRGECLACRAAGGAGAAAAGASGPPPEPCCPTRPAPTAKCACSLLCTGPPPTSPPSGAR